MRVLSLFSGVGGMDMGLERAGHEVVGMCEIDAHARSVLARHWPDVPIHDDVTTLKTEEWHGRVDLVAGGSPCQDLSVAGKRQGLDGARSGLFWHQCRIADSVAAPWLLWENVAGALTSNNGADFAAVLWGITGAFPRVPDGGWRSAGVCVGPKRTAVWRLLDAQWFGVPQRRRRVFVVGGPRDICGPEVLLESESVRGDSAPSREARQEVAGSIGTRSERGGLNKDRDTMTDRCGDIAAPLEARSFKGPNAESAAGGHLLVSGFYPHSSGGMGFGIHEDVSPAITVGTGLGIASPPGVFIENILAKDDGVCGTIAASWKNGQGNAQVDSGICIPVEIQPQAIHQNQRCEVNLSDTAYSISRGGGVPGQGYQAALTSTGVRRLTPRECERLMGWPDDWTRHDADGNEQADSHRYKQCGNGVVSNVAEWIGRRLP